MEKAGNSHFSRRFILGAFAASVVTAAPTFTKAAGFLKGAGDVRILNMISSTAMIKIGKVLGNKMVDMQLSNEKLVNRGIKIIMDSVGINVNDASKLLYKYKSVRNAIKNYKNEI